MTAEVTTEQVRHAIATTYPGWRITIHAGLWWATKHTPPTQAQKAAGLHHQLARQTAHELLAALERQSWLLASTRST